MVMMWEGTNAKQALDDENKRRAKDTPVRVTGR